MKIKNDSPTKDKYEMENEPPMPQNVNCSAKCESNSKNKGKNNSFWILIAYKAMFCDQ